MTYDIIASIVLYKNDVVDCLCHVVRTQRNFEYRANIFQSPFTNDTASELIKLRTAVCHTDVPSFSEALSVIQTYVPEEFDNINIVLDPFAGSGTSLVAAEILGRRWVGIELSPNYAKIAKDRVEPFRIQKSLFNQN